MLVTRNIIRIAALVLLVGCNVPGQFDVPMCEDNTDCDSGETCDEGICFGNPPLLTLAADLLPPEGREDLAQTSIQSLEIMPDGTIANAVFGTTVLVEGRVFLATDASASVNAVIQFSRSSPIPGVSNFIVTAQSSPGAVPGEFSYQVRLPPTNPNNPADKYSVLVQPSDVTDGSGPSPAELVPPTRVRLAITTGKVHDFALGDPDGLKRIEGTLLDSRGGPMVGRTVRAFGQFAPGLPMEIASSLGRTNNNGYFVLLVPISWLDTFDVVVEAPGGSSPGPSMQRRGVVAPDPQGQFQEPTILEDFVMPNFGTPVAYRLPVVGESTAGGTEPAEGAAISLSTILATAPDEVSFIALATSDNNGDAELMLIPGREYSLNIEPAGNSPLAGVWNDTLTAPLELGDLPEHVLAARVPVTGRLFYETLDLPARNVSVLAKPTLTYQYSGLMTDELRTQLGTIALPSATTTNDGGFRIDLDPQLLQQSTTYDLLWQPVLGSLLPRWTHKDVDLGKLSVASQTLDLGDLFLPHAAYSRGAILDSLGEPVPGARIRVYIVPDADSACAEATLPGCVPKAFDAGLFTSDDTGNVVVVLPSPPPL